MPINNYVSNGSFLYGEGNGVLGWELVNAEQTDGGLLLNGGTAKQDISAQYAGYTFYLEASGSALSGKGGRVYVEYISGEYAKGSNDNRKMKETVLGKSSAREFDGSAETLNMEFTLPDGTNNLRLVLEADDGSIFKINNVKMYLKSDM